MYVPTWCGWVGTYLLGVGGWVYFTLNAKTHMFCLFKNGDLEFNSYGSYSDQMGDPYE
jgi:hypothetical protein